LVATAGSGKNSEHELLSFFQSFNAINVMANQLPANNNTFNISLSNGYHARGNISPSGLLSIQPGF